MTVAAVTPVRPIARRSLSSDPCDEAEDYAEGCLHDGRAIHHTRHATRSRATTTAYHTGSYYSCASLEILWISAGGRSSAAFVAAEIAKAESGGYVNATGRAGERGLWQISPGWGSLSTYDPYGNARAAVIISGNGSNWGPWTTYTSGAYGGRC